MMPLLIVGEVIVDFTLTDPSEENKIRLGGIAHAARGLWALGRSFEAAIFVPSYLETIVRDYFQQLGCVRLEVIGYVSGSPNVTIIHDAKETNDQGYDFLLREEKGIKNNRNLDMHWLSDAENVFVIPGQFDLKNTISLMPTARIHIDVAYDVASTDDLQEFSGKIETIFISTSSKLFRQIYASNPGREFDAFSSLYPQICVIKENRGGSRIHSYINGETFSVPAQLGKTVNSVGVGDVYDVAFLVFAEHGNVEAAYRASYASSAYAQTTVPDLFQQKVKRDAALEWNTIEALGGVSLSWANREEYGIYLAAPDFAGADRVAIDKTLSALKYHNFKVRRPVQENGELPSNSDIHKLKATYRKDLALLKECKIVFAVPTNGDPGTLVEVGYAQALGKV